MFFFLLLSIVSAGACKPSSISPFPQALILNFFTAQKARERVRELDRVKEKERDRNTHTEKERDRNTQGERKR